MADGDALADVEASADGLATGLVIGEADARGLALGVGAGSPQAPSTSATTNADMRSVPNIAFLP